MQNFKKLLLLLFLAAIGLWGLKTVVKGVPLEENLFIHSGPETYPLYGEHWVEQQIVPERQKLIGFKLPFKKVNDVDHLVKISLLEKGDKGQGRVLYRTDFSSKLINSNQDYTFWLSQTLAGQNEPIWLHFEASTATNSASVSPIISRVDNYLQGKTISSTGPLAGDVVFKPIYQVPIHKFVGYYLNRIAFGKPVVYHKFILLFILTLGIVLSGLVWVVAGLIFLKNRRQWRLALGIGGLIVIMMVILYYRAQPVFWLRAI